MSRSWGYALLCVFLPVVWGLFIVWMVGRMDALSRRKNREKAPGKQDPDTSLVSPEYHI